MGPSFGRWLTYDQIPPEMRAAMISTEDRRFRSHIGVDPIGIGRAVGSAVLKNHRVSATSTITQQLARNIFLTNNRSFVRKLKEAVLALALERKFSKDQILELYLNRVYFGGGAYGIDAASRKFFGHGADHLSLGEAAIIAGLVKAPSNYSPTADVEAARDRSSVVLQTMARNGFITPDEAASVDPGQDPHPADDQQQQRPLFHRLGAAAARHVDRPDHRSDRRLDHARSRNAGRRRPRNPRQCARRRARRARRDGSRRGGARDGRRQGLCQFDLQPRDPGRAPAGLRLQAVRLSLGARIGDEADRHDRRRAGDDRRLEPAQRQPRATSARSRLREAFSRSINTISAQDRRPARLLDDRRHGAAVRDHHPDLDLSLDGAGDAATSA